MITTLQRALLAFTLLLAGCVPCCPTPTEPDAWEPEPEPRTRLRVINGSTEVMWAFWLGATNGGTLPDAHQIRLAPGAHHDYAIPPGGIASTRFWPGFGCDDTGNNCRVGQSGGPRADGFTCPSTGCAPPIDSKFEGTFGCLTAPCQTNPSSPTHEPLPRIDSWDTSLVDGWTVPYTVAVIGSCPEGPVGGAIDCSGLTLDACPTSEDLSSGGAFPALASLSLVASSTAGNAGCYSDCARLTFGQWDPQAFAPGSPEAQAYCCPTPPVTPEACRAGPVARTGYTAAVHRLCPQVYAYGYDDGTGLWGCPAGTRYGVTFYGPQ